MLLFVCNVWIWRIEYGNNVVLQIMDEFKSVVNLPAESRLQQEWSLLQKTLHECQVQAERNVELCALLALLFDCDEGLR